MHIIAAARVLVHQHPAARPRSGELDVHGLRVRHEVLHLRSHLLRLRDLAVGEVVAADDTAPRLISRGDHLVATLKTAIGRVQPSVDSQVLRRAHKARKLSDVVHGAIVPVPGMAGVRMRPLALIETLGRHLSDWRLIQSHHQFLLLAAMVEGVRHAVAEQVVLDEPLVALAAHFIVGLAEVGGHLVPGLRGVNGASLETVAEYRVRLIVD